MGLLKVNEHFSDKQSAEDDHLSRKVICCGYFEAARRLPNRSLLNVNEDLASKADLKRAEQMALLN